MNRIVSFIVCMLIVLTSSGFPQAPNDSNEVSKVKNAVAQYKSSGKRVVVITRNDERFKGYVKNIEDDKFTINDPKSNSTTTLSFTEVKKVRKSGGLSTGHLVAIVAAGAGVAIILGTFGRYCRNEGGCF